MQATEAVHVLDGVGDNDIETLLGFPLLTKAEPYTAKAQVNSPIWVPRNYTKDQTYLKITKIRNRKQWQ